MKKLFFLFLLMPLASLAQSLLDADSIIVIQNDSFFTAMAVNIYPGLNAATIKQVYLDRYEKAQRLKVDAAKLTIRLNENANKAYTRYFEVTGDTIRLDSVTKSLNGEWTLKIGETSINFTVIDNKSSNKVNLKVVSSEEITLTVKEIGEVSFYKENENTWIAKGKGKEIYRMTRRKVKEKSKQ